MFASKSKGDAMLVAVQTSRTHARQIRLMTHLLAAKRITKR
jgi:hypothetical protein